MELPGRSPLGDPGVPLASFPWVLPGEGCPARGDGPGPAARHSGSSEGSPRFGVAGRRVGRRPLVRPVDERVEHHVDVAKARLYGRPKGRGRTGDPPAWL